MADLDETGAIDWLLIEAPDKTINGELVPPCSTSSIAG